MPFQYQDLIHLFAQTFHAQYNTLLVCGEDEPIYLPAKAPHLAHRIIFAHGFYASALHEISHWLVAGEKRRLIEDYGYWYEPDGRNAIQQKEFEKVEIVPQAIEWALAVSCGFSFDVSVDNLNGASVDRFSFKKRVHTQVLHYLEFGFSARTTQFLKACQAFYQREACQVEHFDYA
ncbi:hypothetical protein PCNPT3_08145 [Psychromonas sp. CNPT3]|uniref:elongation factor P hydroxylase n=1 Tax=Psychromonas sp. CNPT3 TaxID=314282 RepID=UPI00006E5389|nr:elongation factor P hydroxylase [Psychromonas sp. CNPT3]AGH81567.1 hypothetical protein PCNPT3_08145 [Psychromonas sp. CNPT3]